MKCSKCGLEVSIWKRDLKSGVCSSCIEKSKQEELSRQKEAEASRTHAEKLAAIARHGIPNTYPEGCPDCAGSLAPIVIFAREEANLRQGFGVDAAVVHYAGIESAQGIFTGRLKELGQFRASKCDQCHRIFFHGVPLKPEGS